MPREPPPQPETLAAEQHRREVAVLRDELQRRPPQSLWWVTLIVAVTALTFGAGYLVIIYCGLRNYFPCHATEPTGDGALQVAHSAPDSTAVENPYTSLSEASPSGVAEAWASVATEYESEWL